MGCARFSQFAIGGDLSGAATLGLSDNKNAEGSDGYTHIWLGIGLSSSPTRYLPESSLVSVTSLRKESIRRVCSIRRVVQVRRRYHKQCLHGDVRTIRNVFKKRGRCCTRLRPRACGPNLVKRGTAWVSTNAVHVRSTIESKTWLRLTSVRKHASIRESCTGIFMRFRDCSCIGAYCDHASSLVLDPSDPPRNKRLRGVIDSSRRAAWRRGLPRSLRSS